MDPVDGHGPAARERYVVAVDGGNSKTDIAVVTRSGRVLATVRTDGSCHQRVGVAAAVDVLVEGIRSAKELAGVTGSPEAAVLCLAGLDLPVDDETLESALALHHLADRLLLRNDIFAVMRAGARHGWGVAVVCGAGMNCAGQGADGAMVRFPAVGEISGDWAAGGGWLGMIALGAAVRGSDGRGPRTVLEQLVPEHFGLPDPYAVTEAVYTGRLPYGELTMLAPYVFQAASAGEPWARATLDRLADEVVAHVAATLRRLDLTGADVDVVLGGGVFRTDDTAFLERIRSGVLEVAPNADLHPLSSPPIVGAALLALDAVGAPDDAESQIRSTLTHERVAAAPEVTTHEATTPSPAPIEVSAAGAARPAAP